MWFRHDDDGAAGPPKDAAADRFVPKALFATLTNVNFDPARLAELIGQAVALRDQAKTLYEQAAAAAGETPETLAGPAAWTPAPTLDGLVRQGEDVGVQHRIDRLGDTVSHFGDTHPNLALAVGRIATALSNLGI